MKGFTLIELMIALAIMSILMIVMIPNFVLVRNTAKLSACQANLKSIATAAETYSSAYGGLYPTGSFSVTTGCPLWDYIQKRIACPTVDTEYKYTNFLSGTKYYIYCPTTNSPTKHKTKRGSVNQLYFEPSNGTVIVY